MCSCARCCSQVAVHEWLDLAEAGDTSEEEVLLSDEGRWPGTVTRRPFSDKDKRRELVRYFSHAQPLLMPMYAG